VDVRTLPLFPLPLVLFPGVALPLHVFEPRYRRMLADCLAGDRSFGFLFCPAGTDERALAAGHVGCIARVQTASHLPDGRSNIIVVGTERFALQRFAESSAPYHVGEITRYEDVAEPLEPLAPAAARLRETFGRIGRAARTLSDDHTPLPDLPDDPGNLTFRIAGMIDVDAAVKQRLLASRSPSERLRALESLLSAAIPALERRAAAHARAKHNGRGHGASV
jgi:ATP-dependent Lon protease